jgi:hypothetical protein
MLDTGSWMLDEKMNPLFLFIQHQASSIQSRLGGIPPQAMQYLTHQLVGLRRSFASLIKSL